MKSPEIQATLPENMRDWGRYHQIYDHCNIGPSIDTRVPGWYQTFTQMAQATEIPFLNVRTSSIAGETYTNIVSAEKLPWWFQLVSIGLRFKFPDPNVAGGNEHTGLMTMSKWFTQVLPEHAKFEFIIKSYTFIHQLAAHLPPGFGPQGYFEYSVGDNTGFASVMNNSNLDMPNRWKFLGGITLPKDTDIRARLILDDYAKDMLAAWDVVPGIDFGGQDLFPNLPQIELTLRGVSYEQRVGEFRK